MSPVVGDAAAALDTSNWTGLETMQALVDGRLPAPPMAVLLDMRLAEVSRGRAVFEGQPSRNFYNPLGTVHGGWALTLIDSATGVAAHTTLPAGVGFTTVETKVNFARAIRSDTGLVRAVGRTVAEGRSIITAEAHVTDAAGRILAHGTSTLMVLRR